MTVVVAPVMIFGALPTPGIVMLGLALPVLLMIPARLRMSQARVPVGEILIISLFALSVVWSDVPAYSAERLRTYLVVALATVLACNMLPGRTVLRCLYWSIGVIVGSSLLVLATQPERRQFPGLDGVVLLAQFDKNTYGGLLVVALVVLLVQRRRASLAIAPLLGLMIFLNRSVTAWATALLLVFAILLFRRVRQALPKSTARAVLAVVMVSMMGLILGLLLTDSQNLLGAVGKDSTLSRRTEIWEACWDQIQNAPLLGHGAFAFLNIDSDSPVTRYVGEQFLNFQPPHPHNAVLDLWGQVGLAGLTCFALVIAVSLRRGINRALDGDPAGTAGTAILMVVIMYGVSEPSFTGPWLVMVLIAVALANAPREGTASVPPAHDSVWPEPATPPRREPTKASL